MVDFISDNWLIVVIALVIGIAIAFWIWGGGKKPSVTDQTDHHDNIGFDRAIEDSAEEVGDFASTPGHKQDGTQAKYESSSPAGRPNIVAAVGEPDDLRKIKGIGPKLNALLTELGVSRYDQIAGWGEREIAEVDPYLGAFKGRIVRDNWVDQAGYLAKNDIAGFEAKYGKL